MEMDSEDTPLHSLKRTNEEITNEDDSRETSVHIGEVVELIGWGRFQVFLVCIAAVVWMSEAIEVMLMSFLPQTAVCSFPISDAEAALLTTLIFMGMAIGASFFGLISDNFGRKVGFILGTSVTAIAGIMTIFAGAYWTLALCRIFVGFGVSCAHVPIALFSEYSPKKERGKGVIFLAITFSFGLLISIGLAWITLTNFPPNQSWRYYVGFSAIPVILVVSLSPWIPESCRWLLLKKGQEEAKKALRVAAESNGVTELYFPDLVVPVEESSSILDVLSPSLCRTSLLLWIMWFIHTFQYYGAILLVVETSGSPYVCPSLFSRDQPSITNSTITPGNSTTNCIEFTTKKYIDLLVTTCGEIPGILVAFYLVDRIGRKKTMFLGFLIASLCGFSLFICYPMIVATVVVFIFRAVSSASFQTVWLYTPEVYPTAVRTKGTGICVTISRFGGMAAPYAIQYLIGLSREGHVAALATTGCLGFVGAICSLLLPIETKDKILSETIEIVSSPKHIQRQPKIKRFTY